MHSCRITRIGVLRIVRASECRNPRCSVVALLSVLGAGMTLELMSEARGPRHPTAAALTDFWPPKISFSHPVSSAQVLN